MTDRDVLSITPSDADDADMAARLSALYATTPPTTSDQVERCVAAVRARAPHGSVRRVPFGVSSTRWWWGVAAAAVLITATTRPWRGRGVAPAAEPSTLPSALLAAMRGTVTPINGSAVEFDVLLPSAAKQVAIVGDFNGWDAKASPMVRRKGDGAWSARIPLAPGRHTYAFVVDGERWIIDPLAPQVESNDGYGPANALVLGAPSS